MINEGGSLTSKDPMMIVVRVSNRARGIYMIIGQASVDRDYDKVIFPFLDWQYYGPHWQTEDLFLLDWAYVNRASCTQTKTTISDWLRMQICGQENPSCFFGPVTTDTANVEHDLRSQRSHYSGRRIDIVEFDPEWPSTSLLGEEPDDIW